ncbi:MAG: alginate lyase family protein [Planctomycetota bacterium]
MFTSHQLLKLRKMSPEEILGRVGQVFGRRRDRRAYCRGHRNGAPRSTARFDAQRLTEAARALVPGTSRDALETLRRQFPNLFEAMASHAAETAEAVLAGSWKMLGHPFDLRAEIDWHADPRSEHRWPSVFYADVPLAGDGQVDFKYVWELGRQQYLVELARGWQFTGNERFAARAREIMLDWIEHNPLYEGIHWTSALEVAVRAISWLWTLASLSEWAGWQAGELNRVAASLADHATYLENHFSFHSSPYNHLIGEATGLYLIGVALETLDESARWRRTGRRVLSEHGPRQFYADGFCVEQATGYHYFTLGFLTLAIAAARKEGKPLADLEPVVRRAYGAGNAFRQPDGRWPAIGDVDSARSIPVLHEDFWDFNSLSSLAAALFEAPEFKLPSTGPGEELYWVLGCEGVTSWQRLDENRSSTVAVLEDSGYAVAGRGGDWLLFDAGPIADGLHPDRTPSTAHGHADALQVLFFTGGKPALVDPGMPSYSGPEAWVAHFRGPGAHNTIEIEGAPMARTGGKLAWTHVAPRPRLDANLSDDAWLARARAEWAPGVVVERHLLALPGRGLWIADWIETDKPRRIRWTWQLPTGTLHHLRAESSTQCLVEGDGLVLATWSDSTPVQARIETANHKSPIAWNAPGYGDLSIGQRVCHEAQAENRLLVATYIGPSPIPVEMTVRGNRLVCAVGDAFGSLGHDMSHNGKIVVADIIWRVWTEDGLSTYAGGLPTRSTDPGRDCLRGTGGWPAVHVPPTIAAVH